MSGFISAASQWELLRNFLTGLFLYCHVRAPLKMAPVLTLAYFGKPCCGKEARASGSSYQGWAVAESARAAATSSPDNAVWVPAGTQPSGAGGRGGLHPRRLQGWALPWAERSFRALVSAGRHLLPGDSARKARGSRRPRLWTRDEERALPVCRGANPPTI